MRPGGATFDGTGVRFKVRQNQARVAHRGCGVLARAPQRRELVELLIDRVEVEGRQVRSIKWTPAAATLFETAAQVRR